MNYGVCEMLCVVGYLVGEVLWYVYLLFCDVDVKGEVGMGLIVVMIVIDVLLLLY